MYLLCHQRIVVAAFNLSNKELITSTTVCRLNGYCGGYGSKDALEKQLPEMNLPYGIQQHVRSLLLSLVAI